MKKPTITAESKSGVAIFNIRGRIGSENINPEKIGALIDGFLAKGIKAAVINLSSQGGSVFDANDIIAEFATKFGNDNVSVQVGALCASAATCFLTEFKSEARPNSQIMIHKPMMPTGGNETEIERDLTALKNITASYRKAYAVKMGKTEDEVEAMWAAGDKWLTAQEALALKLIDKISGADEPINAEVAEVLSASGAPVHKITANANPKNPKKPFMEREELIASLGLDADATDEQIKAAIAANKKAADDAKAAKDAEKGKEQKNAEKAINAAIASKKLAAPQFDAWVKMYLADPEATAEAIEALPELPKLSAEIDKKKTADLEASRKDWTLDDYLDKDPQAYEKMRKDDPERAGKLEKEYFGKN